MAGPSVKISTVPTGGSIALSIGLGDPSFDQYTTQITIQRYTGSLSNIPVTIYSGEFLYVFIDDGEGLPTYLDFNTTYYYAVTDPSGTTVTAGVVPTPQLVVFSNYLDKLLFRWFSAGISALAVPQEFNAIRVLQALPLTMGSDATIFPFVVMNLDLEQQEYLQIGEDLNTSLTNLNIIPLIIMRRYSVNILSHNALERDFYKDSVMGVILTMMQSLQLVGQDFSYNWQAANTQEPDGPLAPGFYVSIIMFEMTGQFNVAMNTNYPLIASMAPVVSATTGTSGIVVLDP